MRHQVIPWAGGVPGYGDARWDGRYAVSVPGVGIETDTGRLPQPPPGTSRFLRLAGTGLRLACGTQDDNFGWEWTGTAWEKRGPVCGNNPVIYDAQDRLVLALCQPPTGALGWRCLSPTGHLVTAESTYADPTRGVWEYTDMGDCVIGQGADTGCVVRFAADGVRRALTIPGVLDARFDARFVRVSRHGEQIAVTVVCLAQHQTVCWWGTLAELRAMPPVPAPVPPPPEPVPVPPEPPMAIPNHLDVVERWRGVFAGLSGEERAYQIVNAVAYELANEGCGVYAKPNGPHGVSQDVVIFKPNAETFDILGDAEGKATPQWTRTEPTGFGDLTRWRAATKPNVPIDPPDPDPEPPTPPSDHEARIVALEQRCHDLETTVLEETAARMLLEQRVAALTVSGQTGRSFGHSHSISLKVD